MITALGPNGFTLSDFTGDGNNANNTLGSFGVSINACTDLVIDQVRCINHKTNAGYGAGFVFTNMATTNTTGKEVLIRNCQANSNDNVGLLISNTGAGITIRGGVYSYNTSHGIHVNGQGAAPAANTIPNLVIQDTRCERNSGGGIVILGFRVIGLGGVYTYGHGATPTHGALIDNNQCNNNASTGIFAQVCNSQISNNTCRNNGTTNEGGIVANADRTSIINNTVSNNIFYGIDAGFLQQGIVSNNRVYDNGSSTTAGTGINLGGCRNVICEGNILVDNATNILIGKSDAGQYGYEIEARDITVRRNKITQTTLDSNYGIVCSNNPHDVVIDDNSFYWPSGGLTRNCIIGLMASGSIRNNYMVAIGSGNSQALNSAATLVFNDWVDTIRVNSDTAAITGIQSWTEQLYFQKVTSGTVTAAGTGYTSEPTVTISGGGGSGATARAFITIDGRVAGIIITAAGSGYTSTPTASISGGGGSGATATLTASATRVEGKELTLIAFLSNFRVTNSATVNVPAPSGETVSFSSGSQIRFRVQASVYFPVHITHRDGNVWPTTITMDDGTTITRGADTPEAAVTAPVGSLFLRSNGGASTTLYVKESGTGNTGWVAK